MEPKFQSSFIPRGPIATSSTVARTQAAPKSLLGFLATLIFSLAVAASLGVFGYNKYLSYQIGKMGSDLEAARAAMDTESIYELVRLDSRIDSTETLLSRHTMLTPLLELIEDRTVSSVRFTSFQLAPSDNGISLSMNGRAPTYSSLALQAEAFKGSTSLKDPAFTNLTLDEVGNVTFTLTALIDPNLISYQRNLQAVPLPAPVSTTTSSTATSTTQSSTTTPLDQ